jgi:hypothetical protein
MTSKSIIQQKIITMEIDLGTVITGLIIVGICVLPFAFAFLSGKNKEKKMLDALTEMAIQQGCKIHTNEFCGDFVMGIDEVKNYVFFHKLGKEKTLSTFVNLRDIISCSVHKVTKIENMKHQKISIVESVDLVFKSKSAHQDLIFGLFNFEENSRLTGELAFADSWSKKLNERLTVRKAA